ncbi:hypothetical protein SAMD00019534_124210 [Acytostelium subglobosum LB1]|uniref:hypothetical protein n=1 Tax=Acytostelium subglobosum LB1 TaxID=1410327 RepID=UPI000644BAD2|nr:hypothetical protein SAMD00019534_124210 [Acytostelium subglobosum LB1]GAM29245.1 hypothetical protein SAMD00019534_124210 [Acytostelium subglobosum LB1]|eukprot:XP_012747819.1 hypothetical protein SAMD00019534_124210 [Acytostelium subglobosum LB1]
MMGFESYLLSENGDGGGDGSLLNNFNPKDTLLFDYLPFVRFNPDSKQQHHQHKGGFSFSNINNNNNNNNNDSTGEGENMNKTSDSSSSSSSSTTTSSSSADELGVLMIVMINGDIYFYPTDTERLNMLTSKLTQSQSATTQAQTQTSSSTPTQTSSSTSTSNVDSDTGGDTTTKNKYQKMNIALSMNQEHRVHTMDFIEGDSQVSTTPASNGVVGSGEINSKLKDILFNIDSPNPPFRYRRPRKVLLSHDKRLLLIIGCYYKGLRCLTVYKINEEGPNYFQLIFYDTSMAYIDACFSSDSQMLVAILSRFPNYLFFLQLPIAKKLSLDALKLHNQYRQQFCTHNQSTPAPPVGSVDFTGLSNSLYQQQSASFDLWLKSSTVSYDPRKIGPLAIIGPAKNTFGLPFCPTHISCNPTPRLDRIENFEYVTWNDDGLGEYCLWNVSRESQSAAILSNKSMPSLKFEWMTRLIGPIVPDRVWIDKETSPKNYIINMEFSPKGDLVMVIVKRENHDNRSKTANGVGMQVISGNIKAQQQQGREESADEQLKQTGMVGGDPASPWIHVADSVDQILTSKWTESLFFGSGESPSVLIRGVGICEMVSRTSCALFTNGTDEFNHCSNYLQLGRYHRLWMNHMSNIYLITLTPKHNDYIEWQRVFEQKDKAQFKLSLKLVGYNLLDGGGTTGSGGAGGGAAKNADHHTNGHQHHAPAQQTKGSSKQANQKLMNDMLALLSYNNNTISERNGRGEGDAYLGVQLYRCSCCKQTLVKPLICGYCKTVAYCSKQCQHEHWVTHKDSCKQTPAPNPPSLQQHYAQK